MREWLAVDFGTSNSAAACRDENGIRPIELERAKPTLPSAIFFEQKRPQLIVGSPATAAMIEGHEGRYMRSIKKVLGTSLMGERRKIMDRKLDFYEIISEFLIAIKERAEQETGQRFCKAVAGRPVRFSENSDQDAAAKADLARCYEMAGFEQVEFLAEPEAAALSVSDAIGESEIGIVVDIGGGTSDFTAFQKLAGRIEILTSHGVPIGGTDFDRAVNLNFIMPHLGYRQPLKSPMGGKELPAPNWIFGDLATWEKIPFLYEQSTKRLAKTFIRDAVEPRLFERLLYALEEQTGHEIADRAERAKIDANEATGDAVADLSLIEAGLTTTLPRAAQDAAFDPFRAQLTEALHTTLSLANLSATDITHVVPVGGSSLMRSTQAAIHSALPDARPVEANIFTAIVDGLALKAAQL